MWAPPYGHNREYVTVISCECSPETCKKQVAMATVDSKKQPFENHPIQMFNYVMLLSATWEKSKEESKRENFFVWFIFSICNMSLVMNNIKSEKQSIKPVQWWFVLLRFHCLLITFHNVALCYDVVLIYFLWRWECFFFFLNDLISG